MYEMNVTGIDGMFNDLPEVTQKAVANTINFTARAVNKELKKSVSSRYNIKKTSLQLTGGLISIKRANARASLGVAIIFIKRESRGLIKYGAKQLKKGLSVRVKKKRSKIKGGFNAPLFAGSKEEFSFAKGRGKHAGKVLRKTKNGFYEADKREILYGPPISDLYTNDHAGKVIVETIDREFQPELDKQFNRLFEKGGKR
jgi:hypothetical protein